MGDFYEKYWQNDEAPPVQDPFTPARLEIFFKEVKKYPEVKKILDFGCGDGRISKILKEAGFGVAGIDISQNAIQKARDRVAGVEFIAISSEANLPFGDKKFDAIYCSEVIEHIYDTDAAIKEMARILRKDGFLFISTPYHGFLKNLAISLFGFEKHFNPAGPHIRFFSENSLTDLLEANGFEVIKISYLGRFWPFWMDMIIISKIKY